VVLSYKGHDRPREESFLSGLDGICVCECVCVCVGVRVVLAYKERDRPREESFLTGLDGMPAHNSTPRAHSMA
jgi:hypothetical protein